ncbi:MAG: hypothetical protein BMS9Abin32_027 [Gammaproteobacteria bacterium]|nr:MAG: hypothetical protein BMS9Abin32_027 [Gammaproteobacteria bacterium]
MASIAVVAARLALPWPLRAIAAAVTETDFAAGNVADLDARILQLSLLFLFCVAALGLFDYLARLFFSRFSIATTRDLRQAVFSSTIGIDPASRSVASGDLVSRLIGDAARVKAGMQGFLLHVATNGLLFAGATVILWTIDPYMGLFFALAAVMIGLITFWGARSIFRVSLQHRNKEGKLANKIQSSLRKPQPQSKLRRINKSSGRYEASLTRLQGRVTWTAHILFGFVVLGSLQSGVQAVAAGTVTAGDLVLFMFYALMIRGPITRLARQGTRTGKILGPAFRLVQMLQPQPGSDGTTPVLRLRSLKKMLALHGVRPGTSTSTAVSAADSGPLDLSVKRGERVAIVDRSGVFARTLLEVIAGERETGSGFLTWDSAVLEGSNRNALYNQVALLAPAALTSRSMSPLAERFQQIVTAGRRRASVWCYLEPGNGLSPQDAKQVMASLCSNNFANAPTTIVATRNQHGLENYDRIVHLEQGRVVFDGTYGDWRGVQPSTSSTPERPPGGAMKILFAGYAPVHFRCFQPLFERLRDLPGVEVFVSGGLRTKTADGYDYDTAAMYEGFGLPAETVLPVEAIREMDFDVQFSAHTKLILPRRVDKRIQIFHGVSFRNKAVRPENMGCDHYFVIGPYMLRRFTEAGLLRENDARVANIGFMKTDALVDGSLQRESILQGVGFDGSRPVVLYAPTGAKRNSLETMGEDVIRKLLAANKYDLLIKPHDHPKNKDVDWATYLHRYEGAHCRIVEPREDVIPMLFVADLLISDASSVVNEYTLLDRPILFLDTPDLLDQARDARYSMLDLDTWGRAGGMVAESAGDVPSLVAESLADPQRMSLVRRRIAENLFFNHGRATDAAMNWMQEHILPAGRSTEDVNNVITVA